MLSTAVFLTSLLIIAHAQSIPCEQNEFQCPRGGPCFPLFFLCDNIYDCEDGFDEQNCTILSTVPCEENEFRCKPGSPCFPLDYLCSSFYCNDEFYEQECTNVPCLETHFQCPTGSRCFPNGRICNNIYDCDDGYDELNCSTVYLSLSDEIIPNHGYVAISDIGSTDDTALICYTKRPHNIHSGGGWFAPDGSIVNDDNVPGFRTHESPIAVILFRNTSSDPAPEGIYHCVLEVDVLTEQTVAVGLYHSGGIISIPNAPTLTLTADSDLSAVSPGFTLTCISTGGPATTVTWTRDSEAVTEGMTYTVLDDPVTARYTHTLTVSGRLGGLYTCTVANNKPSENSNNFRVQVASAPSNVMAVQEGLTSVRVSWSPPTPLGDTTGYRIYYSGNTSGHVNVTDGSMDNVLLTGLQNGSVYTITIIATSLHFSSTPIDQVVILYPSIITCSQTDYTAAIAGAVVVAVVFIISVTVVIVVLLLRGKQKSSVSAMNSTATKAAEAHEHFELSGDADAIHTSVNEAYHVVHRNSGANKAVTTPPSSAHSTPHPSDQTTVGDSLYEQV